MPDTTTENTENTEQPELPYCITITRPGHDTVHLGFRYAWQATVGAANLEQEKLCTTHIPGTTITYGPTPADVTPTPPLVETAAAIGEAVHHAITGEVDNPRKVEQRFPDVWNRLSAQMGYDQASDLWAAAMRYLDEAYHDRMVELSAKLDAH